MKNSPVKASTPKYINPRSKTYYLLKLLSGCLLTDGVNIKHFYILLCFINRLHCMNEILSQGDFIFVKYIQIVHVDNVL